MTLGMGNINLPGHGAVYIGKMVSGMSNSLLSLVTVSFNFVFVMRKMLTIVAG